MLVSEIETWSYEHFMIIGSNLWLDICRDIYSYVSIKSFAGNFDYVCRILISRVILQSND